MFLQKQWIKNRHKKLLAAMRRDWDERAVKNAPYYIANSRTDWAEPDFYASGEETVSDLIRSDMDRVCQGQEPGEMRVLEIGCGAGRVTRALANVFGEVHAVDVSGEMVRLASAATATLPNVHVYQNNGADLSVLGELTFDFALSTCVFHHIPSKGIIENYIREVGRRLRPGGLFKFEVQGYLGLKSAACDTWLGVALSEAEMRAMAARSGFEARYLDGAGEERFWLWFFKKHP